MDACCLYDHTFVYLPKPQDGRWSKIVLLQKDFFFFFFGFHVIFPIFREFPVQPNPRQTYLSYIFFATNFHIWPKRGGGGGMYLKCTPLDPPMGPPTVLVLIIP